MCIVGTWYYYLERIPRLVVMEQNKHQGQTAKGKERVDHEADNRGKAMTFEQCLDMEQRLERAFKHVQSQKAQAYNEQAKKVWELEVEHARLVMEIDGRRSKRRTADDNESVSSSQPK
ncbi:PREDICTED: uncharacterized protein LOC104801470 [Tarenaya hassleriana]|uniref:uncharacterized protein LOC104801470 n=1 Tax=Tarenaya hassleriana TaxID=28532 RepID=UPI00053C7477|nr:PREDICTED: uncharacterized protein LOC104801470 [Tarenaya hassleriana]